MYLSVYIEIYYIIFFFSSRRRHTRYIGDWSSDVCSSDLDPLERPPDQPRYVHLRDPHLLRDLGLRQPLEEAQVEDQPLAIVQHLEARLEHGAILRDEVLVLLGADRLERVEIVVGCPSAPARR